MAKEFQSINTAPVTKRNIQLAAKALGCEPAVVQAVSMIEAPKGGFLPDPDNRPTILFESHTFHTLTHGKYDAAHPNISTPSWVHNYGAAGSHQYDRLAEALDIDRKDSQIREAALESASWGKYQIMGMNFESAGFTNVEDFVASMVLSEVKQLNAFVSFIVKNNITPALRNKDWARFALRYNGSGQVPYYSGLISAAYNKAVAAGWNT